MHFSADSEKKESVQLSFFACLELLDCTWFKYGLKQSAKARFGKAGSRKKSFFSEQVLFFACHARMSTLKILGPISLGFLVPKKVHFQTVVERPLDRVSKTTHKKLEQHPVSTAQERVSL